MLEDKCVILEVVDGWDIIMEVEGRETEDVFMWRRRLDRGAMENVDVVAQWPNNKKLLSRFVAENSRERK